MKLFLVAALILQHGCVTSSHWRPFPYNMQNHMKEVERCVEDVRDSTRIPRNVAWLACEEHKKEEKTFWYSISHVVAIIGTWFFIRKAME